MKKILVLLSSLFLILNIQSQVNKTKKNAKINNKIAKQHKNNNFIKNCKDLIAQAKKAHQEALASLSSNKKTQSKKVLEKKESYQACTIPLGVGGEAEVESKEKIKNCPGIEYKVNQSKNISNGK